jgi:hypothetical protein
MHNTAVAATGWDEDSESGWSCDNWTVSGDALKNSHKLSFHHTWPICHRPTEYWYVIPFFNRSLSSAAIFYRELRDSNGAVLPDVKAQKSVHFVLGNDSFTMNDRPFKLDYSEAYYKNLMMWIRQP